ncbi:unnamed protein product [Closterium sp. Naga37s-1]|nr:unnamed protein product [Closterium sp. Naga37s-1]
MAARSITAAVLASSPLPPRAAVSRQGAEIGRSVEIQALLDTRAAAAPSVARVECCASSGAASSVIGGASTRAVSSTTAGQRRETNRTDGAREARPVVSRKKRRGLRRVAHLSAGDGTQPSPESARAVWAEVLIVGPLHSARGDEECGESPQGVAGEASCAGGGAQQEGLGARGDGLAGQGGVWSEAVEAELIARAVGGAVVNAGGPLIAGVMCAGAVDAEGAEAAWERLGAEGSAGVSLAGEAEAETKVGESEMARGRLELERAQLELAMRESRGEAERRDSERGAAESGEAEEGEAERGEAEAVEGEVAVGEVEAQKAMRLGEGFEEWGDARNGEDSVCAGDTVGLLVARKGSAGEAEQAERGVRADAGGGSESSDDEAAAVEARPAAFPAALNCTCHTPPRSLLSTAPQPPLPTLDSPRVLTPSCSPCAPPRCIRATCWASHSTPNALPFRAIPTPLRPPATAPPCVLHTNPPPPSAVPGVCVQLLRGARLALRGRGSAGAAARLAAARCCRQLRQPGAALSTRLWLNPWPVRSFLVFSAHRPTRIPCPDAIHSPSSPSIPHPHHPFPHPLMSFLPHALPSQFPTFSEPPNLHVFSSRHPLSVGLVPSPPTSHGSWSVVVCVAAPLVEEATHSAPRVAAFNTIHSPILSFPPAPSSPHGNFYPHPPYVPMAAGGVRGGAAGGRHDGLCPAGGGLQHHLLHPGGPSTPSPASRWAFNTISCIQVGLQHHLLHPGGPSTPSPASRWAFNTISCIQVGLQHHLLHPGGPSTPSPASRRGRGADEEGVDAVLAGAVERSASLASPLLWVDRGCVILLAGQDNAAALANANAMLRRADLFCDVAGPLVFGWLLSAFSPAVCIKASLATMLLSLPILICLVLRTDRQSNGVLSRPKPPAAPLLSLEPPSTQPTSSSSRTDSRGVGRGSSEGATAAGAAGSAPGRDASTRSPSPAAGVPSPALLLTSAARAVAAALTGSCRAAGSVVGMSVRSVVRGWRSFLGQPVLAVSVAYVLLFFNCVLSPGGLITSFLTQQGVDVSVIGAFRGACAAMGFAATFLSPLLITRLGLLQAGGAALLFQSLVLAASLGVFALSHSMGHHHSLLLAFLALIVVSRLGHWTYDVVDAQIFQVAIPPAQANIVGTTEVALASLAELVMLALAIAAHDVRHFGLLAALSAAAVFAAAAIYCAWERSGNHHRRSLFPPEPRLRWWPWGRRKRRAGGAGGGKGAGTGTGAPAAPAA